MVKVIGNETLFVTNPFDALDNLMKVHDVQTITDGSTVTKIISQNHSAVTLANCKAWVTAGGEIEDYSIWIEINNTDEQVPEGVPGATYEDADGVTQSNTWTTWLAPNNHVIEREGSLYVGTNGHTGKPLPLSQLTVVFDDLRDTIPDAPAGE